MKETELTHSFIEQFDFEYEPGFVYVTTRTIKGEETYRLTVEEYCTLMLKGSVYV